MSRCYCPIKAYRTSDNSIIFNNTKGQGIHELTIPCGQCIGCRLNKAESWAVRIMHECQEHEQNSFITLTYSQDHLPPDGNLEFNDVTLFFKRLRKALYPKKIKYFYCGEYGEQFSRPHYHICLFGHDFSDDRTHWRTKDSHKFYRSDLLEKLWQFGHAEIGELEYGSAKYVANYVTKKVTGKQADSHYERCLPSGEIIQVIPEQARMSRKEGIGKRWLQKFWSDVYPHDYTVMEGKKFRVPSYYDKWLEKHNPSLFEKIKIDREASMIDLQNTSIHELNRIHETKLLNQKHFVSRELDGEPAPSPDSAIMNYYKRDRINYHKSKRKDHGT